MSNNQKLHTCHYLYLFDRNQRLTKENEMLMTALRTVQDEFLKVRKELKETQTELMLHAR